MSLYLTRPTVPGQISRTKQRVYALERKLNEPPVHVPGYLAKWSLGGKLVESISGAEQHPTGGTMVRVYATLQVPGAGVTTLKFRKNDVEFGVLKLTAGVRFNETYVNMPFAARIDLATVEITSVGGDAADLAVFGEFDR